MLAFATRELKRLLSASATKALAALSFVLALNGCATTAVPVGDWSRLSDLELSDRSLDHVRVAIECASFDRSGRIQQHKFRLCRNLKPWLQSLGADVIEAADAKNSRPDFTLQYVDGGVVDHQFSAVSVLVSVLTAYVIPYVNSAESESELRVLDARGVEIDRQKMRIQEVTIFGWGAIYAMIVHRDKDDARAISERFYKFAENRLVSQVPERQISGRDL